MPAPSYHRFVRVLLRSVWDEPRPASPPPRRWYDWALVAALMLAVLLEALLRSDLVAPAVSVALGLVLAPTLLWRRTRPLLMVAIAMSACTAAELVIEGDAQLQTLGFLLLLPYSLLRWGSGRAAVLGAAILLGKLSLSTALGHMSLGSMVGGVFAMSAAAALGVALRYRARARARELDQVKLLERERIARDLHDTVAHHVSAMAIRAQAGLAVSASRPQAAVDALRVIEAEASRALTDPPDVAQRIPNAAAPVAPGGIVERRDDPGAGGCGAPDHGLRVIDVDAQHAWGVGPVGLGVEREQDRDHRRGSRRARCRHPRWAPGQSPHP